LTVGDLNVSDIETEFIRLLYAGVLKRPDDEKGLKHHLAKLGSDPTFAQATNELSGFVSSQESRSLRVIHRDASHPSEQAVAGIVSIGSHCYTSFALKRWGLKRFSGPFDWIFSGLGMVADCIADDFLALLDHRFYAPIPFEFRRSQTSDFCDHTLYKEQYGLKSIFNHANPQEEKTYDLLTRCVSRFRGLLQSKDRNIFLGVCEEYRASVDDFHRVCDLLDKTIAGEALVVSLLPPTETLDVEFKLSLSRGRHKLYSMRPTRQLGALRFTSEFDDLLIRRLVDTLEFAFPS
jgi:Putative papain-like cysteine peptidase (DUF1796)